MITIDLLRCAKALCRLLMFLVMEFMAYGFAEIGRTSDRTGEKVFSGFMVLLFFIFAFVVFC